MVFSINSAGFHTYGKNYPDPSLIPYIITNSKYVTGQNMEGKIIHLLEKNILEHIDVLGIGKVFLNRTQKY